MDKEKIRSQFKYLRQKVENREVASKTIFKKLLTNEHFLKAETVLLYVSTVDEVDTREIIEYCWQEQKTTFFPFIKEVKIGVAVSFDDFERLEFREKLFHQPKTEVKIPIIDLAIVPALAYDAEGNRLGSGSGWYDRFLSENEVSYKIGICFKQQISKSLPVETHDIMVNEVITD